jgi:hypothetical protein
MPAYIPALVIQKNSSVFIGTTGVTVQKSGGTVITSGVGLSTEIPTPEGGGAPDGDYWAIPTNDSGIVSSFTYLPYNANDPVGSAYGATNPMAFKVCRIMNTLASDYWYIVGTVAQYITADGGAALPTTITAQIAGCQSLGEWDVNNKYFVVLQLPNLSTASNTNSRYYPYGSFNGVALPAASSAGYATSSTLLTFLNANWTNVGSPNSTINWTVSADGLTLLGEESSGVGIDRFCGAIAAINPSL